MLGADTELQVYKDEKQAMKILETKFSKVELDQIQIHPVARLPFALSHQLHSQPTKAALPINPELLQTVHSDIPMAIKEANVIHRPRYFVYTNWTLLTPGFEQAFVNQYLPILEVEKITKSKAELEAWRFLLSKISTGADKGTLVTSAADLIKNCPDNVLDELLLQGPETLIQKVSSITGESIAKVRYRLKQLRSEGSRND